MNEQDNSSKKDILAEMLKKIQAEEATSSGTVREETPVEDFSLEDYQVVRREFFSHIYEPSITLWNCRMVVNTACLRKLPKTEYIQILVNVNTKTLVLRPCSERERDVFRWCSTGSGKREPRILTCRIFFAKIVDLMNWEPDCRYKIFGRAVYDCTGECLLVFDLNTAEKYCISSNKSPRTPIFPKEWREQFGVPYDEHQKLIEIRTFDEYTIYKVIHDTEDSQTNTYEESVLNDK